MVRKHQTRNLEIPGSRVARPGKTPLTTYFVAFCKNAMRSARSLASDIPA